MKSLMILPHSQYFYHLIFSISVIQELGLQHQNPAGDLILKGAEIKNSGIKRKHLALMSCFQECFMLSTYITAFDVTSAPDPAVVGITASLVYFFSNG